MRPKDAEEELIPAVKRELARMGVDQVCTTLSALTALQMNAAPATSPLTSAVAKTVSSMSASEVSSVLCAEGKLQLEPHDARAPLFATLMQHSEAMSEHELAQAGMGLDWLNCHVSSKSGLHVSSVATKAAQEHVAAVDSI